MPAVGALDDPAARLSVDDAQQRRLATASDVRDDPSLAYLAFGVRVVVALVQTKVDRAARSARRPDDHGVEGGSRHPLVVNVGAGDLYGERDAASIREDVTFDTFLRAIRGVRSSVIPPFGAFTIALSRLDHFHAIPRTAS